MEWLQAPSRSTWKILFLSAYIQGVHVTPTFLFNALWGRFNQSKRGINMSLLQEMEKHGLADCKFNRNLLPDSISIEWHFTDIQEIDDTLTNDEARKVLQLLKKCHDCNIGINWDVIESTIETFLRG